MLETVIVVVIVLLAAVFVGRDLYRSAAAGEKCGCAETCPLARECGVIAGREEGSPVEERGARCTLLDDEARLWRS
ncbi:MAG: FeoB-associated Cys-rich membrane protein [Candidatus Krumholzibacteriia bacterium]